MIYAVGDIHGELDLLDQLMVNIRLDARGYRDDEHKLIFVGDYIDRGPMSSGVLDRVMAGFEGFETICLRGNHEQAMLEACRRGCGDVAKVWLSKVIGGGETLKSYGIDPALVRAAIDSEDEIETLFDEVPENHLDFIEGLPLLHRDGQYLFVHAGIRPGIELDAQMEDDFLWIRKEFTLSRFDYGFIVVHGHTWRKKPQVRKNRIGIDTGAYSTGRLTAVALDQENKPRFIQAIRGR